MNEYDNYEKTQYIPNAEKRKPSLIILEKENGKENIRVVELNKNMMTIGRKTDTNAADISLSSSIVSREHGVFHIENGEYLYTDTNSLNGTSVNGGWLGVNSVRAQNTVRLSDGDVLRIDRTELNHPHREAVTMVFSTSFDTQSNWKSVRLTEGCQISIGRQSGSGIMLPNMAVSREHALIFVSGGKLYLKDCGSKNGVMLNNNPVYGTREMYERNVIKICDTVIFVLHGTLLYNTRQTAEGGLVINIKETNVNNGLSGQKKLLEDINCTINKGDFVLVLGGSGAGKSTLFNSILGKYKVEGRISLSDAYSGGNGEDLSDLMAYVPQFLTIRKEERLIDVITDTALLRGKPMSPMQRKKHIDQVLSVVGLQSKRNNFIKDLSGGEQKRAAIANELVTQPKVFFLDEPDSGLDPDNGRSLVRNLRELSDSGIIVMMISHGYSSYSLDTFTKILVLAKSDKKQTGTLAFLGSPTEALEFFGVASLADITRLINPISENGEGRADEFVEKFNRRNRR